MNGLPNRPGTDETDPQVMKSCATAAKARNTRERKLYEKKFPLFVHEARVVTAEDMLEQRIRVQAGSQEWFREFHTRRIAEARRYRAEARSLCRDDQEFFMLMEKAIRSGSGQSKDSRWYRMMYKLRGRREPLTLDQDLVLALLQTWEGEPPTAHEFMRSRGDGMTIETITSALHGLLDRELIKICLGRRCTVSGVPCGATWQAT